MKFLNETSVREYIVTREKDFLSFHAWPETHYLNFSFVSTELSFAKSDKRASHLQGI